MILTDNNNLDVKSYQDKYLNLAEDILKLAKQAKASSAQVHASLNNGINIDVRNANVDTIEFNKDQALTITVYFNKAKGIVSISDLSYAAIKQAVAKACSIAKIMTPDPFSGLADKELLAYSYPDLDLYHPWDKNTEQLINLAIDCEAAARQYSSKITNLEGTSVSTNLGLDILANTNNFIGKTLSSQHSLTCIPLAISDTDMQRSYWSSYSRVPSKLQSAAEVGRLAAKRTVAKLDPRLIKTTQAPVLFIPETAVDLLSHFLQAASGSLLYKEASFLLNKLNTDIFSKNINLIERPYVKQELGSSAYDTEGVRTSEKYFVKSGKLLNYILSCYSARRLNLRTTANAGGVHNLYLLPENYTYLDLIKKMHTGLIVTELMGHGGNILTGEYSQGACGFWVENGEVQYPVREITIAGNLQEIFNNIIAIGNDVDNRGNFKSGSILIEKMIVAGK